MNKSKFLALEKMFKSQDINDHILGWELVMQDESITGIHLRYLYVLCNVSAKAMISERVEQAYDGTRSLFNGGVLNEFSLEKFLLDD